MTIIHLDYRSSEVGQLRFPGPRRAFWKRQLLSRQRPTCRALLSFSPYLDMLAHYERFVADCVRRPTFYNHHTDNTAHLEIKPLL